MGAINEVFSQNKITFSKIDNILRDFLKKAKNKSQNIIALHEIGLLKEFSYIKSEKNNQFINISQKNRIIKQYLSKEELKENFVEWTKFLFDIKEENNDMVNQKLDCLKQKGLNKELFQKNLKNYLFTSKPLIELTAMGIPKYMREFVWDVAIGEKYNNHKYFNYDEEEKIFNSLLKKFKNNTQIEKDLKRTFVKESEQTIINLQKLRNILNAISIYNNGYCQGMNFIAGFLLKLTNFDEIQTFYIFKNILNDIKGYFENDFPLLKKNMYIFDSYFKELYPKLYKHFKKVELYNELWIGKWFQSLFILSFPFDELSNIWDILIIKGFDYIIYISLAIIGSIEDELLQIKDSSDILAYLKNVLNPKEKITINKELIEGQEKLYIIPLKKIFSKAFKIEKKLIKNNYNVNIGKNLYRNSFSFIKEKNDIHCDNDSISTKDTEFPIMKKNSFSTCSSISGLHQKNLKSSNSLDANNINIPKSNLCQSRFGLNNGIIKNPNFDCSRNIKKLNLNDINAKLNATENLNNNNIFIYSLYNYNCPKQAGQCIYYINYNGLNYNIFNGPQYSNFLIYYA